MSEEGGEYKVFDGKCSISIFTDTPCGFSLHHSSDANMIKLDLNECNRSVTRHLESININTKDIESEGHLIAYRCGLFDISDLGLYSVCPLHRDNKGLYWEKKSTCQFPEHTGVAKAYRTASLLMIKTVLKSFGVLLPVGAGKKYSHKAVSTIIYRGTFKLYWQGSKLTLILAAITT